MPNEPEITPPGEPRPADDYASASAGNSTSPPVSVVPDTGKVEIAHVLFMDIVGYARLPMEQQARVVNQLQAVVQDTADFREANSRGELLCLPRGDGMALVFFRDALAPLRCAVEIARELKTRTHILLRMGVNTGPVYVVEDINHDRDVSGPGIIEASRVMDRGDAGHILISGSVADHASKLTAWRPYVHDLRQGTVKHGQQVHVYNFHTPEVGNPDYPRRQLAEHASVVERVQPRKSRQRVSPLADFRDSLIIVSWTVFILGGMGWGLWTISPAFRDMFKRDAASGSPGARDASARSGVPKKADNEIPNVQGGSSGSAVSAPLSAPENRKPNRPSSPDSGIGVNRVPDTSNAPLTPPSINVALASEEGVVAEGGRADGEAEPKEEVISETHMVEVTLRMPSDYQDSREVALWYRDERNGGETAKTWSAVMAGDSINWSEEIYGKEFSIIVKVNDHSVINKKYRIRLK